MRAIDVLRADAAPLNVASTDIHPCISLDVFPGDYQLCPEHDGKIGMFLTCCLLQPGKYVGKILCCLCLFCIVFPLYPVDAALI